MKVKDRMTTNVKTVDYEASITTAFSLMKENSIRRLPVMDKGKIVNIITLSDLNQVTPSLATTLSVYELNYLLAKTKIKDVLPKRRKLLTIGPEDYIETAARIMRQNTVSGLPVVDDFGNLVGIITETDIFDALIHILGVYQPHSRIDIYTEDRPGSLHQIAGLISGKGINILNIVAYYDQKKGKYKIILRLASLECNDLVEELKQHGYEIESVAIKEISEEPIFL